VRDSLYVFVDDLRLISNHDYTVDFTTRTVRLTNTWPIGSTVRIEYRALPVDWPLTYRWMTAVELPSDTADVTSRTFVTDRERRSEPAGDLRIGGVKTFAIQVGTNRDLTLEQSLRVSISGTVGDDVYVTAELSDQNLPIQPEGTTEDIREIDKVLVEVESPHYRAVLGSYDFLYRRGEFGAYDRRLEGALLQARYDRWSATGGVASARGRYRSYELPVIDGIQGPYRLVDDMGNDNVIVIAGSERVWLNGQALRRGQNNDYVMDYGAGEIMFTRSRLVTDDMRIVVDYEYAGEDYGRSSALMTGELNGENERWRVAVFFAQEGDNVDDPLALPLDDSALDAIRAAGDDPMGAARPGWTQDSTGAYRVVDLSAAHFERVGDAMVPADERYSVLFSRVAPGEGTYNRVEGYFVNEYRWVGPGLGNYVPYILFPLPNRTRLTTVHAHAVPIQGITTEVEVALSERDENTLSSLDDGDNRHWAGRATIRTDELSLGDAGTVTVTATGRRVDEGFTALSRTTSAEDNRRWGLPLSANRDQERTGEISAVYSPARDHKLVVDAGWFDRDSSATSTAHTARRAGVGWTSTGRESPEIRTYTEVIHAESDGVSGSPVETQIYRGNGFLRHTIGYTRPNMRVEGELDQSEESGSRVRGARFGEYVAELSSAGSEQFAASVSVGQRAEQLWDTTLTNWEDRQRSITHTWRGAVRTWRGVSANAEYSWRRRTGPAVGGANVSDLADVSLTYDPWDGLMRHDVRYQVSSTRTAEREAVYLFAGEGRGDYRALDPNEERAILSETEVEPVTPGDPEGAYVLRYRSTDNFRPTVSLDASYRLNLSPDRAWRGAIDPRSPVQRPLWQRVLRNIRTETQLQVSEIDTSRSFELYSVQFWKFRQPGKSPTLRGSWSLLQDVLLWPTGRLGDIRLRVRSSESYDATLLGSSSTTSASPSVTERREYSVRARRRLPSLDMDWTGNVSREREKRVGSTFDYRANRWLLDQTWSYHPTFLTELAVRNELGVGSDPTPTASVAANVDDPVRAYLVSFEPIWRRAWGNRGMIRLSAQWSGVYSENLVQFATLPIELLGGRDVGNNFRWTAIANYRLSSLITASLTYTGRKSPKRDTIHSGRMEMRAVF